MDFDLAGSLLGGGGSAGIEARSSARSTNTNTFGSLGDTSSGNASQLPWLLAAVGAVLLLFLVAFNKR